MSITSSLRSLAAIFFLCSGLLIPSLAHALGTQVLSNFNQPSSGVTVRIDVSDVEAIPFITDGSFTEFQGVELAAATLFAPGLFFVEIWDVDAFAQPNNVIAVLSGPSAPAGLSSYTGAASLQPNTSYFLVYGLRNGGSQVIVATIDFNDADATPAPIYEFGTDIDNDGNADLINRCRGTRANDYVTIGWDCGGLIAPRYFSKLRFLAEEPAPPVNYSLTATPLSVDFGLVPSGTTSTAVPVTITNDGNVDQLLGMLDVGPRFTLSNDNCSGQPLAQNGTCIFEVSFTPDHGGFTTGTVVIPASLADPRSPYGLPLVGESDQPVTLRPLEFIKAFAPNTILAGETSQLILGFINYNIVDATSVSVTDDLPTGMTVANPANVINGCVGGTVTATPGTAVVSYTGGTVLPGLANNCNVRVDVTSSTAGASINTTGDLTSSAGNSGPKSATLTVLPTYPLEFTVNGLVPSNPPGQPENSVVLLNNGGDAISIFSDGTFSFPTELADGDSYNVIIDFQPAGQTCTVANGSGTVAGAAVTNVSVSCVDNQYTIGGLLSGLIAGESVMLQNNGGDTLTLTGDGAFGFVTTVGFGDPYSAMVITQPGPITETCTVTNGSGTTPASNVDNISVVCAINSFSAGGSVSGLAAGETVVLQNNGADSLSISVDGNFTFSPQADGTDYAITVSTQPTGQTCSVANGSGTLVGADIATATVTCVDSSSPPGSETAKPVPVMPAWLLGLMLALMTGFGFIGIKRDR
ncbi:MAG: hypothetical protein V7696_08320 [Halioglobus sp.]